MPDIRDFLGQISDGDDSDVPHGAAFTQTNVSTTFNGKLKVRGGIQPASFDATSTISASAYHTFQRMSFVKTRFGDLIGVNGIDRGFRWDGITATVEDLGLTAPAAAPAIVAAAPTGGVKGNSITGVATNGGKYRITSGNSLSNGDKVRIGNVVGTGAMSNDLNGSVFTVESVSSTLFTLVGTSFDGAYSSGGTWSAEGYGATAGVYTFGYRYLDNTATGIPSSLTAVTTITANENDFFAWSSLSTTAEVRAQHKFQLFRSTAGVTNAMYRVATSAYGGSVTFSDEVDDTVLNNSSVEDVLLILSNPPADNTLVARRFNPPPNDRPIVVQLQNRYFYVGSVQYNRGTVATNGSTTLTGTGTDWVDTMIDRYVYIDGEVAPIKITAVASGTSLTLETAAATTASSKTYTIRIEASKRRQVMFSEPDEPESVPTVNVFTIQESTGDNDDIIGAMPLNNTLFFLGKRSKYAFNYSVKPTIDGSVRYVEDRGAFNHYCWALHENVAYMMDDSGPYAFSGSSQPIGEKIHDLFRKDGDGDKIDFTKSDKFHVAVDRAKTRVYYFVSFIGDAETIPTRALVYNLRRQTWDIYHYPQKISSTSVIQINGESRLALGAENSSVHLADSGTTDIVTSETTGTTSSSSGTTLVDSAASFGSSVVGASVYIYEGTGKGQRRTITARTSTQLTVATWATNPDTTSKYVVGAVVWSWKSNAFGLPSLEGRSKREISIKFKPTTGDSRVDVRFYYNNSTTPITNGMSQKLGDAVEVQESNKEDAVIFLQATRNDLENASGHERFRFDGQYSSISHGDHRVSVEMRGFAGDDTQEIQRINIEGVE